MTGLRSDWHVAQNAQHEQPSAPQNPLSSDVGMFDVHAFACAWPCTPHDDAQPQAVFIASVFALAVGRGWYWLP